VNFKIVKSSSYGPVGSIHLRVGRAAGYAHAGAAVHDWRLFPEVLDHDTSKGNRQYPRPALIRTGRDEYGTLRADYHMSEPEVGKICRALGQAVRAFDVRGHKYLSPGLQLQILSPFSSAASVESALSSASGPSTTHPLICPRSFILDSAAASIVDCRFGFTNSVAESIATRGFEFPRAWQLPRRS